MKQGDLVEAIDTAGVVKYKGTFLGSGHPTQSVGVRDRSKIHHAIQINDRGDTVYLEAFYWTLRTVP